MNYCELIEVGTPVVVRSYTSGVVVGRIRSGEGGVVAVTDWCWLRRWEGVGGSGSVYDLVNSGKGVTDKSPLEPTVTFLQQADVMVITEATYARLTV